MFPNTINLCGLPPDWHLPRARLFQTQLFVSAVSGPGQQTRGQTREREIRKEIEKQEGEKEKGRGEKKKSWRFHTHVKQNVLKCDSHRKSDGEKKHIAKTVQQFVGFVLLIRAKPNPQTVRH